MAKAAGVSVSNHVSYDKLNNRIRAKINSL